MSKRRLTKQQTVRINERQKDYHQEKILHQDSLIEGLVLCTYNKQAEIETMQGNRMRCGIRANVENLVAGDKVICELSTTSQHVIVSLCPRTSILARPVRGGLKKIIAANVSQLIIVIAPKPQITWPLLDSYLVMAEILGLNALIILNKTDLPCKDLKTALTRDYQPLGYPLLFTNQSDKKSYRSLELALTEQVSVFVGQSGVGKSSLIAGILPHEESIVIGNLSEGPKLGRHTTTNSRYYHLPSNGALIDSPGIREFSLWSVEKSQLAQGYKEFVPYIPLCKFRNCPHKDTPHCAIIEAVGKGDISMQRYSNFLKLSGQ